MEIQVPPIKKLTLDEAARVRRAIIWRLPIKNGK